mgnify:FL=1
MDMNALLYSSSCAINYHSLVLPVELRWPLCFALAVFIEFTALGVYEILFLDVEDGHLCQAGRLLDFHFFTK